MNELELKKLWQTTNNKLEASIVIYKNNTDDITRVKVHSILGSMKPIKIFTLLVGILWVGIGGIALSLIYLNSFSEANKFFLFSASIQIGLTAVALLVYLYQLITIYQVDITDPILRTQEKLSNLKMSTLWVTRILFLQLPVWTTFWWSETMLTDWSILQWSITLIFTISFTIVAFWLFLNIKYENRNKKWFKLIFNGKEWTPLMKSIELLEQVEEYKEQNAST
jgi:large-conductance mechanosensitive channel